MPLHVCHFFFFFFNDTATTEIYTLSLHDALPISNTDVARALGEPSALVRFWRIRPAGDGVCPLSVAASHAPVGSARLTSQLTETGVVGESLDKTQDRKSTRLNSSHLVISYAVFCLKKKKIS